MDPNILSFIFHSSTEGENMFAQSTLNTDLRFQSKSALVISLSGAQEISFFLGFRRLDVLAGGLISELCFRCEGGSDGNGLWSRNWKGGWEVKGALSPCSEIDLSVNDFDLIGTYNFFLIIFTARILIRLETLWNLVSFKYYILTMLVSQRARSNKIDWVMFYISNRTQATSHWWAWSGR